MQIRWISSVGSGPFLKKVPIGENQATLGKILDKSLHFTVFPIHWTFFDAEPIGGRKTSIIEIIFGLLEAGCIHSFINSKQSYLIFQLS